MLKRCKSKIPPIKSCFSSSFGYLNLGARGQRLQTWAALWVETPRSWTPPGLPVWRLWRAVRSSGRPSAGQCGWTALWRDSPRILGCYIALSTPDQSDPFLKENSSIFIYVKREKLFCPLLSSAFLPILLHITTKHPATERKKTSHLKS